MADEEDWNTVTEQRDALLHQQRVNQSATNLLPNITFEAAMNELRRSEDERALWTPFLSEITRFAEAPPEPKKTGGNPIFCIASSAVSSIASAASACIPIGGASSEFSDRSLIDERDFLLCLAKMSVDLSRSLHRRILLTIHRLLTRPKREDPDPILPGDASWQSIGFQGHDPTTDLRAGGMFALMQLLYLVDFRPVFAHDALLLARTKTYDFPLALVSLALSCMCIDALQQRLLHRAAAAERDRIATAKSSEGGANFCTACANHLNDPVTAATSYFYLGCLHWFAFEWVKKPEGRCVMEFNDVKTALKQHVMKNVESTIEKGHKGTSSLSSSTSTAGEGYRKGTLINLGLGLPPPSGANPSTPMTQAEANAAAIDGAATAAFGMHRNDDVENNAQGGSGGGLSSAGQVGEGTTHIPAQHLRQRSQ